MDAIGICIQVWEGTPAAAVALAGLAAAVIEPTSARHRRRPRTGATLATTAALLFIACGALAGRGRVLAALLLLAAAIAAAAMAVWLLRGAAERGSNGGGGGRGPDLGPAEPSGGIDWDAFEREFHAYADARSRVLVG